MRVLITAGGTREYIDDVRVLTNISSGKLGSIIAEELHRAGHNIFYVYARGSVIPSNIQNIYEITNVDSLKKIMEELIPLVDVVIHTMTVSDFGFEPITTKLKSTDKEAFIQSLAERIKYNPKIISYIKEWNKEWNKDVILIGFKFEVGLNYFELINIATESLEKNKCDYVIANDKKEMKDENIHVAYLIDKNKNVKALSGKEDIALNIKNILTTINK